MNTIITQEDISLLENFLRKKSKEIVSAQQAKGLRASGKSADELSVNITVDTGQLIDGSGSFYFQEKGRGLGKVPYSKIYDWLQWKKYSLNWENDKDRNSLAFLIWRKISKYGTKTHIDGAVTGAVTGVISEPLNDSDLREFISQLSEKKSIEIKSDIIKEFGL